MAMPLCLNDDKQHTWTCCKKSTAYRNLVHVQVKRRLTGKGALMRVVVAADEDGFPLLPSYSRDPAATAEGILKRNEEEITLTS